MKKFKVGQWIVEQEHNQISWQDDTRPLRRKVMLLLVYLAENSERIVSREELINQLWAGNFGVGEKALTNAIWQLRSELGKPPEAEECILTVPKSGYQLLLPVTRSSEAEVESKNTNQAAGVIRRGQNRLLLILLASALFISFVYFLTVIYNEQSAHDTAKQWNIATAKVLTEVSGRNNYARINQDGTMFIISKRVDGQSDLFIQSIEGSESGRRITNNPQTETSPSWSKDGSKIVFIRGSNSQDCGIYILDLLKNQEDLLTSCYSHLISKLQWSPDEKYLAIYDKRLDQENGGIYLFELSTRQKSLLPIPGSSRHYLDGFLAWAPNSEEFAFTRSTRIKQNELYLYNLAQKNTRRLTYDSAFISGMTWTASGESILFSSSRHSKNSIWEVNLLGDSPEEVIPKAQHPSAAIKSNVVIYEHMVENLSIHSVNIKQKSVIDLPSHNESSDRTPAFASNTQQYVYRSDRSKINLFWLADFESNRHIPITLPTQLLDPSFPVLSPDGNSIAFIAKSKDSDFYHIHTLALNTKELKQISFDSGDHFVPNWSEDGQSIYAANPLSGRWELWQYPIDGSTSKPLTKQGGGFYRAINGKEYFTKSDSVGIWTLDAENKESLVVEKLSQVDWGNWDVIDTGIYFIERSQIADSVVFYSFAEQSYFPIVHFEPNTVATERNFSVDYLGENILLVINNNARNQIRVLKT